MSICQPLHFSRFEIVILFSESKAAHLIGCDKKSEIVQHSQGRLCDKKGLLCYKLCDFLGLINIVFPGFKGENHVNFV